MNILAAILIISATGSAQRSLVVEQQVSGIVARVAWGAVSDVGLPKGFVVIVST